MDERVEARVETIALGENRDEPKLAVPSARFCQDRGIDGDAHASLGHRQVSLMAQEDEDEDEDENSDAAADAANLVVSGVDLRSLGLGSQLRLGSEVLLTITGLGAGSAARPGLYARVLEGGTVAVGHGVQVVQRIDRSAFQVVVLTLSDRGSRAETADTAGPAAAELVKTAMAAHVYRTQILPDDKDTLAARLRHYADGHDIDLILTVGGTGLSPRDVTPEAVRDVIERATPGLDEAMRLASLAVTPFAMLSRACSGIRRQTLIVSLPGSQRAAVENLQVILAALPHGLAKLRGDGSDCAPRPTP